MLLNKHAIGRVLRRHRKHHKMTQTHVCNLTGIHRSHLSQVENGVRGFGDRNLYKLLDIYGLGREQFIDYVLKEETALKIENETDRRLSLTPITDPVARDTLTPMIGDIV